MKEKLAYEQHNEGIIRLWRVVSTGPSNVVPTCLLTMSGSMRLSASL